MSEKIVGNIHMSSRQFGHDCTFTWRLRNLSLIRSRTKPIVWHDFALHPKCEKRWFIIVGRVVEGFEVRVGTLSSKVPKVVPPTNIGLYNRKGDLVSPNKPESGKGDNVCMVLKMRLGEDNTVIIGDGKVVELEDDTLVMSGRVVVPTCCSRTEIDKEETAVVPKTTEVLDYCELINEGFVVA